MSTTEDSTLPQLYNFTVCKEIYQPKVEDFVSKNIGKCVMTKEETAALDVPLWNTDLYLIQYENIPDNISIYFKREQEEGIPYQYRLNSRLFREKDILFWSENKSDCKAYIDAHKYDTL